MRPSLRAVFDFAWHSHEFTATEVIEATALTRSTAISAIDSLVARGILRELPNLRTTGHYRLGRPARRFELRDDARILVGVDAGHEHLTIAVANLRGSIIHTHKEHFDLGITDGVERRHIIERAVDAALDGVGRSRSDVLVICAGVPAPVDVNGESPRHRNDFWQLMNPGLRAAFEKWAPIVRVDNDALLAAAAEGASGAAIGCKNYLTILAGGRLGAGVVIDGHELRGAHGGMGEMAAFELVTGVDGAVGIGHIAVEWAREEIAQGQGGALAAIPAETLDGRTILQMAAEGDPAAQAIAERLGIMLSRIVGVLSGILNPSLVIIAGAVADGVAPVIDVARRELPRLMDLPVPELVTSDLGADVVIRGAVTAAKDCAQMHALDVWASAPDDASHLPTDRDDIEMES